MENNLIENGYVITNIFNEIQLDDYVIDMVTDEVIENSLNPKNLDCRYDFQADDTPFEMHKTTNCTYEQSLIYDEFIKNNSNKIKTFMQKWFVIKNISNETKNYFEILTYNLLKNYYEIDNRKNLQHYADFTMYDRNCFIRHHKDGKTENRICVLLIYLNKEVSDSELGGRLIITDKGGNKITIEPKYGTAVILDFTHNNIEHEVTKVENWKRYAFVNFVKLIK